MIEGLLRIDKPAGPTSHDLVAAVRRSLGVRRVGHTGTLDPFASGLLLVAVGRATRLIRYLPASPKAYTGTIRLGLRTASDDLTGAVLARHDGTLPDPDEVRAEAAALVGRVLQTPPAVSAKKIAGRRAYRLAREGRDVPVRPVEVEVVRFDLAVADGTPGSFSFEAVVSAGTYVRALARDLGDRLGCGGALASLRRTAIGPFRVEGAVPLPADRRDPPDAAALAGAIVPVDELPLVPPALVLASGDLAARFRHGSAVPVAADPGPRTVRGPDGRLLGVAEVGDDGTARPRVVLPPA